MKAKKIRAFEDTTIITAQDGSRYICGKTNRIGAKNYTPQKTTDSLFNIKLNTSKDGSNNIRLTKKGIKVGEDSFKIDGIKKVSPTANSIVYVIGTNQITVIKNNFPDFSGESRRRLIIIPRVGFLQTHCASGVLIVLDSDGKLRTYGSNRYGLQGTGSATGVNLSRIDLRTFKGVSVSSTRAVAWDENGKVYYWGHSFDKLSDGQFYACFSPVRCGGFENKVISQVALGNHFGLFLTEEGKLYQLNEAREASQGPEICRVLKGIKIRSISAGHDHWVALSKDGEVYTWGANKHGQLGLGHNAFQESPCKIPLFTVEDTKPEKMSAQRSIKFTPTATPEQLTQLRELLSQMDVAEEDVLSLGPAYNQVSIKFTTEDAPSLSSIPEVGTSQSANDKKKKLAK